MVSCTTSSRQRVGTLGGGGKRTSRLFPAMSIQRAGHWSIQYVATEPLQDIREGKQFGGAPPPVRIPSVIVHVIKSLRPSYLYLDAASDQRLEGVETKPITLRYKTYHRTATLQSTPSWTPMHLHWRSGSGTPSELHTPSWTSAVS